MGTAKKTKSDEIDDIFAKKSKINTPQTDQSGAVRKTTKTQSAKAVAKAVTKETKETEDTTSHKGKTKAVSEATEVVFAELAAAKQATRTSKPPSKPRDDDGFSDSRGTRGNKRMTEDGYPIYDVKDLRIGEGGDTPDCPFDCQCCF